MMKNYWVCVAFSLSQFGCGSTSDDAAPNGPRGSASAGNAAVGARPSTIANGGHSGSVGSATGGIERVAGGANGNVVVGAAGNTLSNNATGGGNAAASGSGAGGADRAAGGSNSLPTQGGNGGRGNASGATAKGGSATGGTDRAAGGIAVNNPGGGASGRGNGGGATARGGSATGGTERAAGGQNPVILGGSSGRVGQAGSGVAGTPSFGTAGSVVVNGTGGAPSGGASGSSAVPCGTSGLSCAANEVCVDQVIVPNLNPTPTHSYFCKTNTCGSSPVSCDCASSICTDTWGGVAMCGSFTGGISCTIEAVCNSPDTPIATPQGERPVSAIRVGDLVYSVEHEAIVAVPVVRIGRHRAVNHHVVRVTLESGRVLEISGTHPTADGRRFAELRAGGLLDGQRLTAVETIDYSHDYTYDIRPASDSGVYFAGGVLIGSTLAYCPTTAAEVLIGGP